MFGQDHPSIISLLYLLSIMILHSKSAFITTLTLPSIDHHTELISNRTYRDLYLREYFLDLLNSSQPEFVRRQEIIPRLEQSLFIKSIDVFALLSLVCVVQPRRRRQSSSSNPVSIIPSSNCSMINSNEMQRIFSWFYSIESHSSVELIYHFNRTFSSRLPIRMKMIFSDHTREYPFVMTYLQYDFNRDVYFIDLSDYLRHNQDRMIHLNVQLFDQICSTSRAYLILSAKQIIDHEPTMSSCRLKTLPIQFDQLGLANLIIRPQTYIFTYCDGSCSKNSPPEQSFQRFLQHLLSQTHSNIPPLRCQPSEYANDHFLLRQLDGHMAIYPIENAIVKRCACL